jgi:hypothetical protein
VKRRSRIILGWVLVVAAVCVTVTGYILGDPLVILQKAVNICLECIGVG